MFQTGISNRPRGFRAIERDSVGNHFFLHPESGGSTGIE